MTFSKRGKGATMIDDFRENLVREIQNSPNDTTMNEIVSQNIIDIMKMYDLTAVDLSNICQCSTSGVYRWVKAQNTPKFVVLYPLAKALGVPLNVFAKPHGVKNCIINNVKTVQTQPDQLTEEEETIIKKYQKLDLDTKQAIYVLLNKLVPSEE